MESGRVGEPPGGPAKTPDHSTTGLLDHFAQLWLSLRDLVFPPVCIGCEKNETEKGLICGKCLEQLNLNPLPSISMPEWTGITHLRALGPYTTPFSNLVHQLKYYNRTSLARVLGRPLAGLVLSDSQFKSADVLVPIPLHSSRLRERGYNQSQLLAEAVARETSKPWGDALKRVRCTKDQVNLDDRARRRNLEGAFSVRGRIDLKGLRVLLIDDVATTGATLGAAALVLTQAGAAEVMGLVVAGAAGARRPLATLQANSAQRGRLIRTGAGDTAQFVLPATLPE